MKVGLDSLLPFAVGADRADVVHGAWRAHRLPAAMEERYLQQDQDDKFRIRFSCGSCVRLRFVSDTRRVRIGLRYGFEARAVYRGALRVDGGEVAFGPETRSETWDEVIFEQPTATKRLFDLWLPHLCQADLLGMEVDDRCTFEPAPALPLRWLAYGDSITQGMTATLPTRTVIARCALALNAAVQNVALGSAMLDNWLADTLPSGPYDLVSIAYGTNDHHKGAPSEVFQENARRLLAALTKKRPDCPILLLTPLTWANHPEANSIGLTMDDYRRALAPLAGEFQQVRLVHGDRLLPDDEQWFVDQVHPNDRGFALYAENLLPRLEAALGR